MRGKLKRWKRLTLKEQLLCIQVFFLSAFVRLILVSTSFRKVMHRLQRTDLHQSELSSETKAIKIAIELIRGNTPWRMKCMEQAILGKYLLNKRKIKSTIYLGVLKSPEDQELKAHAWLSVNDEILIGGEVREGYQVIGIF